MNKPTKAEIGKAREAVLRYAKRWRLWRNSKVVVFNTDKFEDAVTHLVRLERQARKRRAA